MTPLHLFLSFSAIGLFAYGGGYAVISFLQQELERGGWMSPERFVDFVAISQCTPGPIAINTATFIGYHSSGIPGAVAATAGVALPGMLLMMVTATLFLHYYELPSVRAMFSGLRPVVAGLIAAAAWQIAQVSIVNAGTAVITLVGVVLLVRWNVHPVLLILGSAVAGMLLF